MSARPLVHETRPLSRRKRALERKRCRATHIALRSRATHGPETLAQVRHLIALVYTSGETLIA